MTSLRDFEQTRSRHESTAGRTESWTACLPLGTSTLRPGEAVFQIGESKRNIYRVETGTIGISGVLPSGARQLIEEISSGMVFGLGFLEEHVHEAIALSQSVISRWSKNALPFLEAVDPTAAQRIAIETEREFIHRRRTLVASAPKTPRGLLAGFLCVASRINDSQGRDANLIDETVDCASVAAFLRVDLATLQQALVELRDRRLVAYEAPRGLRILDSDGLQSLANNESARQPSVAIGACFNA